MTAWLLNEELIRRLMVVLAVATPLIGAGLIAARARPPFDRVSRRRRIAVVVLGPLALAMWLFYNAIVARYGLDSLRALGINALAFTVVGGGLGVGWRRLRTRDERGES